MEKYQIEGRGIHMKKYLLIKPLLLTLILALSGQAHAVGSGSIGDGSGSISRNGSTTTVKQASDKLIINWDNMNVGNAETLNFIQKDANAAVLNRINSIDPTTILGALNANGRVFIVNPNGVLIGNGAQVKVGSLVASALNISDAAFNSDALNFAEGNGRVRNQGEINATGSVALIGAAGVENTGVIKAVGDVVLAAADSISLSFAGNNLQAQLSQASLDAVINNGGLIVTQDGNIALTAWARDAITRSVINNSGSLEANRVNHAEGVIRLASLGSGRLNVGGSLTADGDIVVKGQSVHVQDGAKLSAADGNINLVATGTSSTAAYVKFGRAELTAQALNITADNVATAAAEADLPELNVEEANVAAATRDRDLLVGGVLAADQMATLHNGQGVISDGFIKAGKGVELSVSTQGLGQLILTNDKLNYGALSLRAEQGDIRFDRSIHADRITAKTNANIEQAEAADLIVEDFLALDAQGVLHQRADMLGGEYGHIHLRGGAALHQRRGTQTRGEDISYRGNRLILSGATLSSDTVTIGGGSGGILLDGELRSDSLQINAAGNVRQTARASINADALGLDGAEANFDLSAGKNAIGWLQISDANSVKIRVTDDLSLSALTTTGDMEIRSEKKLETSDAYSIFAGGKLNLEAGDRLLLGGQVTAVRHAHFAAGRAGIDVQGQIHAGSATMRTQGDITQQEGSLIDVAGNLSYQLGSQSKVVMQPGASRKVGGKISGLPVEPRPKPPKPWWAFWMWWW
jgi:filamentous hemagglutinin family protein